MSVGCNNTKRPLPPDFREMASVMGQLALRAHYKCGQSVIDRWHRLIGGNPRGGIYHARKPVPVDFKQSARVMNKDALRKHYQTTDRIINRWLAETGVEAAKIYAADPHNKKPIPADFAAVAVTMSQRSLCKHYGAARETVRRWVAETGVQTPRPRPDRRSSKPPKPKIRSAFPSDQIKHEDLRQWTPEDEAADILRRERFIVYRCDERGLFAAKGALWRVGNTVCTPDEILSRAERYRRRAA